MTIRGPLTAFIWTWKNVGRVEAFDLLRREIIGSRICARRGHEWEDMTDWEDVGFGYPVRTGGGWFCERCHEWETDAALVPQITRTVKPLRQKDA